MKACDPWAVHSAKQETGETAAQLLPVQEKMLEIIKDKNAVLPTELAEMLNLDLRELERNFAILRHMELLRGFKGNDGKVYWTLFKP